MVALLTEAGVDFVGRLHQLRTADFRGGRRLGKEDHVVTWPRPAKPDWMDEETYQRMPASIEVRETKVRVENPGYRVKSLVVVTTLSDAKTYTKADIAELYHKRWLAELDIRAIKIKSLPDKACNRNCGISETHECAVIFVYRRIFGNLIYN